MKIIFATRCCSCIPVICWPAERVWFPGFEEKVCRADLSASMAAYVSDEDFRGVPTDAPIHGFYNLLCVWDLSC